MRSLGSKKDWAGGRNGRQCAAVMTRRSPAPSTTKPRPRRTCGALRRRRPASSRHGSGNSQNPFVLGWKKLGLERSLGTRLVNYADDLVILCRRGSAESALHHLREIMGKLKLTVNEEKTRICRVPDGEFDFLGYTCVT